MNQDDDDFYTIPDEKESFVKKLFKKKKFVNDFNDEDEREKTRKEAEKKAREEEKEREKQEKERQELEESLREEQEEQEFKYEEENIKYQSKIINSSGEIESTSDYKIKKGIFVIFGIAIVTFCMLFVINLYKNSNVDQSIVLRSDVIGVRVNDGVQIELYSNSNTLYYSTNDKDIIRLNEKTGYVEGIKEGTARVDIKNDANETATVTIKVSDKTIKVDNFFVTNTLTVKEGYYTLIKIELDPLEATNSKFKFRSNNDSIATVDDTGKVHGINNGSCSISVTSQDGITKNIVVNVD